MDAVKRIERETVLAAGDPAAVYGERLRARREAVERLERQDGQVANARLALFVLAAILAWFSWGRGAFSAWWLLLPAAAFVALLVVHDRLLTRKARAQRAVVFYEQGLARLDGSWPGKGIDGARFDDPEHPYARDLDLFGSGSLFERICVARTAAGEETLARWLAGPASPKEIAARQGAVAELRERLDLREDLAVLGADVRAQVDPVRLAGWGAAGSALPGRGWWVAAAVLTAAGIAAVLAWPLAGAGPLPLVVVGVADFLLLRRLKEPLGTAAAALEKPGRDLSVLAEVLARLEREPVEAERLRALQALLVQDGEPASERIARLARRIEMLQAQANQFFAPIAFLLLWPVHLGYAIESWRGRHGAQVARWLEAVGELEALSSLASYAFESPGDPFPTVEEGPAHFVGERLAHPLLQGAVANDISLGGALQALVISGSNMSGKSTMLRTVGINAVLAQAGAPVRARALRLSPLAVGGTLRVQDSLQQGTSRFYAELTRLKQLVEISTGAPSLLFLIDEIFHGTNSHDRRIGAEAILRGLIERGAIGMLTTHDLALAQAAEALAPKAENVHFEDHLEEGRLAFDYTMRPGVVRKSNALELMRAVGLEV
ncbi:MutS-related protein [Vulgatibacter sp.]|uniref:MutS-related protein n=1 Tax=Vulgatibacter sp. TaxID=1971226 RepID=UPI0035673D0C